MVYLRRLLLRPCLLRVRVADRVKDTPQRVDADGNLQFDEALTGAAREARYAALEERAIRFVDDVLTVDRGPG